MIEDGHVWIEMLERRNLLAHTYDESLLDETVRLISDRYLAGLAQLHNFLQAR